jgi:3-(3-hydroxy-phenyl)propionate hydroxylase
LFVPGRSQAKLVRGGPLPQGFVRAAGGDVLLSDEALGPALTLIAFGRDPLESLSGTEARDFAACGGKIVQIAHRGQTGGLRRDGAFEDLDGTFMPGAAPFGWAAIVRPDRTVLHDGPIAEVDRLIRESLAVMRAPSQVEAPTYAVPALSV